MSVLTQSFERKKKYLDSSIDEKEVMGTSLDENYLSNATICEKQD